MSFAVGWWMPAFYDWTGADQSRSSPLIGYTALAMLAGVVATWIALPWLPINDPTELSIAHRRIQFKLQHLLAMTAAAAVLIATLVKFPMPVSGLLCGLACCRFAWFCICFPQHRWKAAALLACMCLPFLWIVTWGDTFFPEILWLASGMPGLLPACLIGVLTGHNPQDMLWLAVLLTGVEMTVGTWIIRLGPKRTIAYLISVLTISAYGSLGFHALIRA
ncbi:MAG: hypothetical protein AB8B91_18225 [Rubripirellula sp.]